MSCPAIDSPAGDAVCGNAEMPKPEIREHHGFRLYHFPGATVTNAIVLVGHGAYQPKDKPITAKRELWFFTDQGTVTLVSAKSSVESVLSGTLPIGPGEKLYPVHKNEKVSNYFLDALRHLPDLG